MASSGTCNGKPERNMGIDSDCNHTECGKRGDRLHYDRAWFSVLQYFQQSDSAFQDMAAGV